MKVLVVEDETLIGMDLVLQLQEWGYAATGPCGSVRDALSEISRQTPDFALLDVNLGGEETSFPIAEALQASGVPFAFLTGYNRSRFSQHEIFASAIVLPKPVPEGDLQRILQDQKADG